MKLPLILAATFVAAVIAGMASATELVDGVDGVVMVGAAVAYPTFSGLLALWVTMTGTHWLLWRVVVVVAIGVAWECSQSPSNGIQGLTIPAMAYFTATAVAFLTLRASGLRLIDVTAKASRLKHRVAGSTAPAANAPANLASCRFRWSLWAQLSVMAALAVLAALTHLLMLHVPAFTMEAFLGWPVVLFAGYYSLMLPLLLMALIDVERSHRRTAKAGLSATVVAAAIIVYTQFPDWQMVPLMILMPTVCFGIGFGVLRVVGFELILEEGRSPPAE